MEEGDADERLTTSLVSISDSDAGSGSTADSVNRSIGCCGVVLHPVVSMVLYTICLVLVPF